MESESPKSLGTLSRGFSTGSYGEEAAPRMGSGRRGGRNKRGTGAGDSTLGDSYASPSTQTSRSRRGSAGKNRRAGRGSGPPKENGSRALQANAAEFVPGGMPFAAPRTMQPPQYSYPPYHYGAAPSNFMGTWSPHGSTPQYLAPSHPHAFPHIHMMASNMDLSAEPTLVEYSPNVDGDEDPLDITASNRPLQTDATIVSIAPHDDELDATVEEPSVRDAFKLSSSETSAATASQSEVQGLAIVSNSNEASMPDKSLTNESKIINDISVANSTFPDTFESLGKKNEAAGDGDVLDAFTSVVASAKSTGAVISGKGGMHVKDDILDSWEDVGAVAAPTPSPKLALVPSLEPAPITVPAERFTYSKARLMELRVELSTQPPANLPSFIVERSSSGDSRAGRRLGPGTTRGGGAGAGGGGSGGGRYGGSMDDPRRDQSLRHGTDSARGGRHRKADHTAASDKWDRGQRVKQKDGSQEHWGPEPFEPLKTSAHRWDRKHKAVDVLEISLSNVTSILNKMTPENFDKLSRQLCDLEMTSSEMLRRVIGVLFDKAVDEPHFAVVYAALCARLAEATRVWPFIRSVKNEAEGTWSWVADLDVDTSKLHPLPDFSAVTQLFSSPDHDFESVGIGQLQLQPSDCFLKNDTLICCYFAEQRPGVVFAVIHDAKNTFGDNKTKLFGTFTTKEEAQQDAMKKASFKRLLLNQCQEEFERNVRSSGGTAALEAAAREAKEKAKLNVIEAARLAVEQGMPPKEAPDELELEVWVMKLKRRMLGNVKFIGELFKQQLLKEKIMHECVKLLLGSLDDSNAVPDDESIEAAAKLFLTIGKQLESPSASKAKLDAYCKRLSALSRDKKRLTTARTRFMLQDLLECRKNGWKERRAKDGPHKLGASKATAIQQQQGRNDIQCRRDQERSIARERQRQVVSQQQQQQRVLGPVSSATGSSQDARQQRHIQSSTVRILARDQEVTIVDKGNAPPLETQKLWTDDRVTNRARSSLDEHAQLADADELVASLEEVPTLNRIYKRIFELAVNRIVDGKDTERVAAFETVLALLKKSRLKPVDVTEALIETLEFLPDISIDSPKAIEHVAKLLASLLELRILNVAWLTQDSGQKIGNPTDGAVPECAMLFEKICSCLSNGPEVLEIKSHLKKFI